MIKYETSIDQPERISELCKKAISARLFVNGWALKDYLREPVRVTRICLAYNENKFIGVSIVNKYNTVMVFVRKKHRNHGIGTELIKNVSVGIKTSYGYGIAGSDEFYRSLQTKGILK